MLHPVAVHTCVCMKFPKHAGIVIIITFSSLMHLSVCGIDFPIPPVCRSHSIPNQPLTLLLLPSDNAKLPFPSRPSTGSQDRLPDYQSTKLISHALPVSLVGWLERDKIFSSQVAVRTRIATQWDMPFWGNKRWMIFGRVGDLRERGRQTGMEREMGMRMKCETHAEATNG